MKLTQYQTTTHPFSRVTRELAFLGGGGWGQGVKDLSYSKTGNKKLATCFATLLQNELNSDVTRFTTHIQTDLATNKVAWFTGVFAV